MRRTAKTQKRNLNSAAKMTKLKIKFSYSELPIVRSKRFSDSTED
jgi:hypothetical protein